MSRIRKILGLERLQPAPSLERIIKSVRSDLSANGTVRLIRLDEILILVDSYASTFEPTLGPSAVWTIADRPALPKYLAAAIEELPRQYRMIVDQKSSTWMKAIDAGNYTKVRKEIRIFSQLIEDVLRQPGRRPPPGYFSTDETR